MRHSWILCWGLCLSLAGCSVLGIHKPPKLKPDELEGCYDLPREDDKRYSTAFQYPKNVLADDAIKQGFGGPVQQAGGSKMPKMGMGGPGGY
jgi:hypothetical protein